MRFLLHPKFGIRLMAIWATLLALLTLANLLLLSLAVEFYSNEYGNQLQVWIVFGLNVAFACSFTAAAYGLWIQQNWGRLLFLWAIGLWAIFNMMALALPGLDQKYTAFDLIIDGARFAVTLAFPVFYLNRPHIRSFFFTGNTPDSSIIQ